MAVATLAAISCGCGGGHHDKEAKTFLRRRVRSRGSPHESSFLRSTMRFASSVKSLNATVELKTTAGSQYSGLIQEYHEVKAFLLAARPANVRMVGQAPVIGKNDF